MKKFIVVFKALSGTTRLRIIRVLLEARTKLCVCEIMDALGESQYNISRHLKELKIAGLVEEQREGRWVFYSVVKAKDEFQKSVLEAIKAISKTFFSLDIKRLKARLSLRKGGRCVIGMESSEWKELISNYANNLGLH